MKLVLSHTPLTFFVVVPSVIETFPCFVSDLDLFLLFLFVSVSHCMSRPVRSQPDLDYQILHSTGRKVRKTREKQTNNMSELQMKANDIGSDVEDFFDSYVLDELNKEEELREYVEKLDVLKREFRRIHSQLKRTEGENFSSMYPEFDNYLTRLTEDFKAANRKLSENRAQSKANETQREAQVISAQNDKVKSRCATERDFFIDQTKWELDFQWDDISDLEAIKTLTSKLESRLEKFGILCSEVEVWFKGTPNAHEVREENEKFISSLQNKILSGRARFCVQFG